MSVQCSFEILQCLPTYGPPAQPFCATGLGMHREGCVVSFMPANAIPWIGNFQLGLSSFNGVFRHPNGDHFIIVAGGSAYVVDPSSKQFINSFGGQIESVHELPKLRSVLFGNGIWFELHNQDGPVWRSKRISWDGMKDIFVTEKYVSGKAWCFDDTWHEFQVLLSSGTVIGGAYTGPD